jgi:hypothetical protein
MVPNETPTNESPFSFQDPSLPAQIQEKQTLLSSLPKNDEELYTTWKKLEAHLEFLELQEVSHEPSWSRCNAVGRALTHRPGVYP